MVKSCCAYGCTSRFCKGSMISFYQFPKDDNLRRLWKAAVDRKDWQPNEHSYICSLHFVSGKRSSEPSHPDYVQSVFPHISSLRKEKLTKSLERYQNTKQRREKRQESVRREVAAKVLIDLHHSATAEEHDATPPGNSVSVACQTDLTMMDLQESTVFTRSLMFECESLRNDKSVLKEELEKITINADSFKNDEKKVLFYTGLPSFTTLIVILTVVQPCLKNVQSKTLNYFQQLIMVLMRLRLNLKGEDIAYRFGVSSSTVSRLFRKWMDILYVVLSPLVRWPDHDELRKTLPLDFHKCFRKCVCIIDCSEVFIEKPSDFKARAQTWSTYKQHNTVKYLIGITPQGSISYMSKGWGGRVSDKFLTEYCGFLDNILPGDLILADRGFTIEDSVGMYCAELKIPAFTKGKKQLSRREIDETRELAHVRIHRPVKTKIHHHGGAYSYLPYLW